MKPNTKAARSKKATAKRKAAPVKAPVANLKPNETAGDPGVPPTATPEVVQQPEAQPPAGPAPVQAQATTAAPEPVQLGHVECIGQFVPIESVLGLLGKPSLERIAALVETTAISDLAERVRVTDGRCAPVYFTEGKPPTFYHGYENLAAAQRAMLTKIFVVIIPTDDLDYVQSHLVAEAHKSKPSASPT